jgi:hypothetical protein
MTRKKPEGVPDQGRTPGTAELAACIEARDLDGLIALMDDSGRIPLLRRAEKLAKRILKDEPDVIYAWGVEMAGCPNWAGRMMASWLFSPYYAEHQKEVQQLLL